MQNSDSKITVNLMLYNVIHINDCFLCNLVLNTEFTFFNFFFGGGGLLITVIQYYQIKAFIAILFFPQIQ